MKITKKLTAMAASAVMALTSVPFAGMNAAAADKNYYEALAMSLYFFDSNACGKGITGGPLTWRGDCHTYDAEASVGSLDGSAKSVVDPDGDGKVDVSGGWHDAGDHIKFNLTIGFALSSLGMSEYFNEGIYEKVGARDHLEYEMRWGADYLMKTTFLDDSGNVAAIAGTVANGDVDHAIWTSPEVQTYQRDVFWLTPSKNNSAVCGEMACGLLASAYVLKGSDPTFAADCVKYAKAILDFGKKNKGNNCDGMSFYSTDSMCEDEFALASAWLWILGEGDKPTLKPERGQYDGIYDYYIYTWDKVWQGYSALMYKATGDTVYSDELKFELDNQGGLKVGDYNANGWGASRYNCAKQMDSYLLADGNADSDYAKGAKYQIDTILGDNSYNYSFLLGFGDNYPTHIHHRAANPGENGETSAANPSAKYTNYGMLVGGIDGSGYEDHADRYQYTEGALDYNGCFAIACSFAANLYGGDASTFESIKSSASEINESFKFGDGSSPVVTTPQETTTVAQETTTTTVQETTTTAAQETTTAAQETTTIPDTVIMPVTTTRPGDNQHKQDFSDVIVSVEGDVVTFKEHGSFKIAQQIDIQKLSDYVGNTVKVSFLDYAGTEIMTIYNVEAIGFSGETRYGDANEDGTINMADATFIVQHVGNKDKYKLTEQGEINADVDGIKGVTGTDALVIQKYIAKVLDTEFPVKNS